MRRRDLYAAQATVLLAMSLPASAVTAPNPSELARCASIAASDARLACYDSLSGIAGRAAPTAPTTPAPGATAATTPEATAPGAKNAAPPALAVPAPALTSSAPSDARNFGLSQAQVHKSPEGPSAIQAHIAKIVNNKYGRNYVELDNGQAWTYTDSDEDARLVPGDVVTIKRASLGSFLMKTPSRNAYHVRRTR